jgi:hypothetical protein
MGGSAVRRLGVGMYLHVPSGAIIERWESRIDSPNGAGWYIRTAEGDLLGPLPSLREARKFVATLPPEIPPNENANLFVIVDKETFASQVLGVVGLPTDGYKIRNRRKKGSVERAVYQWSCGCTADIAESPMCPNVVEATFVKMCTSHKKRSIFVR